MPRPWKELTSAERMDAVLLAVAEVAGREGGATASAVAVKVQEEHRFGETKRGNHGTGNTTRRMNDAVRVTPAITALRSRGLITFGERPDGLSGTADRLTAAGRERVRELRATNEKGSMAEDTLEDRIAKVKAATGYDDADEEAVLEAEGFTYGDRVRVVEDNEEEGVFAGDEGFVLPCKVGAAAYGNERVMLAFLIDGFDSPVEVTPDSIEQIDD